MQVKQMVTRFVCPSQVNNDSIGQFYSTKDIQGHPANRTVDGQTYQ